MAHCRACPGDVLLNDLNLQHERSSSGSGFLLQASWRKKHPTWEFRLWTDADNR